MSLIQGKEYLYLTKMGMPSFQSGVSFGFIVITPAAIYYVPTLTQDVRGYGLSFMINLTQQNVDQVDGIPFFEIVPRLASRLNSVSELDACLAELVQKIPSSVMIRHADVVQIKLGFFAGFTVQTADKKVRFSVGGKRKEIANYLSQNGLLRI